MPRTIPLSLRRIGRRAAAMRRHLRQRGMSGLSLWPVAVLVGIVTGYVILGFLWAILRLEELIYGADQWAVHSHAATLDWWYVLLAPVCGGLVVGQLLRFAPGGRARGMDEVIQSAVLKAGRMSKRQGVVSGLCSIITLSSGGSTGREGPAVHIGAVIASWFSERLDASAVTARDILGCAAAAAVSASFNAPLAGALFALEVVL